VAWLQCEQLRLGELQILGIQDSIDERHELHNVALIFVVYGINPFIVVVASIDPFVVLVVFASIVVDVAVAVPVVNIGGCGCIAVHCFIAVVVVVIIVVVHRANVF
jgi:hypothetical protein